MTGLTEYTNANVQRNENFVKEHPQIRGYYNYIRTDKAPTSVYNYIITAEKMLETVDKEPKELTFDDFITLITIQVVQLKGEVLVFDSKDTSQGCVVHVDEIDDEGEGGSIEQFVVEETFHVVVGVHAQILHHATDDGG